MIDWIEEEAIDAIERYRSAAEKQLPAQIVELARERINTTLQSAQSCRDTARRRAELFEREVLLCRPDDGGPAENCLDFTAERVAEAGSAANIARNHEQRAEVVIEKCEKELR